MLSTNVVAAKPAAPSGAGLDGTQASVPDVTGSGSAGARSASRPLRASIVNSSSSLERLTNRTNLHRGSLVCNPRSTNGHGERSNGRNRTTNGNHRPPRWSRAPTAIDGAPQPRSTTCCGGPGPSRPGRYVAAWRPRGRDFHPRGAAQCDVTTGGGVSFQHLCRHRDRRRPTHAGPASTHVRSAAAGRFSGAASEAQLLAATLALALRCVRARS